MDRYNEFIQKMKDILHGTIPPFTSPEQMLFYHICQPDDEAAKQAVMGCSPNNFRSYTKERRSPRALAKKISNFSPETFADFLFEYDQGKLCDPFKKGILFDDISVAFRLNDDEDNVYLWCGNTFASILEDAKCIKDNRSCSWTRQPKALCPTPEQMQEITSVEEKELTLPEKQQTEDFPYSSGDRLLLQEFTADYDGPMTLLLKEDYANALIDMTFPSMVQSLYTDKWQDKANSFTNPNLKSYVFSLLGELDNICKSILSEAPEQQGIRSSRLRIRNLYVKLHPELYAGSFPFEAFIDDWNDAEF